MATPTTAVPASRITRHAVPLRGPLAARSTRETHRSATPLELFFDLSFVIAIARITAALSHRIADGEALTGIVPFVQVAFAIWWAWMNFTWFASAYDNDDALHRLLTMLQMAGVLVLAAGVSSALDHGDYRGITVGYLIMRVGLVALWLRAAIACPDGRWTALRYAAGVAALEVGWVLRLVIAEQQVLSGTGLLAAFGVLVAAEITVPWWAERSRRSDPTSWHPHHIAERYGLFTIILLGESLFAVSVGVRTAIAQGLAHGEVAVVAAGGFVLTMSLWWRYFLDRPGDGLACARHRSFWWGYGHFGIVAALAALGAGLEVAAGHTLGHAAASSLAVGLAVAVPVATFFVVVAVVNRAVARQSPFPPRWTAATVVTVLALPFALSSVGPAAVVAAVGATCAAAVLVAGVELRPGRPAIAAVGSSPVPEQPRRP
jgi:low temperature requirement protein LtrA